MKFYCQLDYKHISYPSKTSPNGNIADNGCGVCCVSMVLENLYNIPFSIEECSQFSKARGAREGFGTDMFILSSAIANKFNIEVTPTLDTKEALRFLQEGNGYVIANTIGDREDWIGVFSDSRHYIVLTGANGNEVSVLDPLLADGRYDVEGREGKVRLEGVVAYADFSVIENDCLGKRYYLFKKIA